MANITHTQSFRADQLGGKDPMKVLLDALQHIKQPYWLSAGTLLGFERDNGFIPYDTDIDIALFGDNTVKLPKEYDPIRFIDHNGMPMQRAYIHEPTNIIFDMFHYYENGDKIYNTQEKGTIHRTKSLVTPLEQKEYLGHVFSVPNDIDAYLTEWYGDWRTPVQGGKTEWER